LGGGGARSVREERSAGTSNAGAGARADRLKEREVECGNIDVGYTSRALHLCVQFSQWSCTAVRDGTGPALYTEAGGQEVISPRNWLERPWVLE
jgi:hypothetical protein